MNKSHQVRYIAFECVMSHTDDPCCIHISHVSSVTQTNHVRINYVLIDSVAQGLRQTPHYQDAQRMKTKEGTR